MSVWFSDTSDTGSGKASKPDARLSVLGDLPVGCDRGTSKPDKLLVTFLSPAALFSWHHLAQRELFRRLNVLTCCHLAHARKVFWGPAGWYVFFHPSCGSSVLLTYQQVAEIGNSPVRSIRRRFVSGERRLFFCWFISVFAGETDLC